MEEMSIEDGRDGVDSTRVIDLLTAKIRSVRSSRAGPPFDVLNLIPTSPCGPAGLWLALRMIPP